MGKTYPLLDDRLRDFIRQQPLFFVGTAPSTGGHVNISPKGYADTFTVLDDTTVAYLDLDGSGVETVSHLRDNGRITIMFCSFDRRASILRLYGTGRVVTYREPEFPDLLARFGTRPGVRSIVVVECERIADSCGWSVPRMSLVEERSTLDRWAVREDVRERRGIRAAGDRVSIDELPGFVGGEYDPTGRPS
ncbi:pyridoxamine 5'-phosphate oxidase family protein [Kitasatospora sp. LaBMicrA B282]|uniref:pyridoxamine 5'-phosphate oxidase family protein n=1 Tax=Kitasatospora sp. LaBMicrA B282 TaxID=3420949 RepID=UPI003D10B946